MIALGRLLVVCGVVVSVVGLLLMVSEKIPFLGRLPGDIVIQRKNVTIYFPVVTSLLLSLILSLILWFWSRR